MEKKRMMEHGAVQEEISLRIEYDIHKCEDSLRTEGKITKEVLGGTTSSAAGVCLSAIFWTSRRRRMPYFKKSRLCWQTAHT